MEHIGIDLHKRESQICILTDEGEMIERRIQTTRQQFTKMFAARSRARVLLEATTESEWVAQTIEALGHEVIVADPNYAPMYPARRRRVKTDRRDARMLAEAARLGSYRPAHRVSATQRQVRRLLGARDLLVGARQRTIAHIRALVRSEGLRVRGGNADRFGTYVRALELPTELEAVVGPLLVVWEQLTDQLADADAQITATAATNPVVQRLTTAPGVGPVIATAFVATLDEAGRFGGARQVASYLGLVPSEDSSAEGRRRGHITKAGNPRMRWLLVQAAWAAQRSRRAEGPACGPGRTNSRNAAGPGSPRWAGAPVGGRPVCHVARPDDLRRRPLPKGGVRLGSGSSRTGPSGTAVAGRRIGG